MSKRKSVLYLYLDGLQYEFLKDTETARVLAPNLMGLADRGFIKPVVPNGPFTQMAMAPMFTQTYPLDYGGYDDGIGSRPKSFVELLQDYGYRTYLVASSYITGPMWNVERGFSVLRCLYDWRQVFKFRQHLHTMKYEIGEMERNGENPKNLETYIQLKWNPILEYACRSEYRLDEWGVSRYFRKPGKKDVERIDRERHLLQSKPKVVIDKIKQIPAERYFLYLGQERLHGASIFRKAAERIKRWLTWVFNTLGPGAMPLFPNRNVAGANRIVKTAFDLIRQKTNHPWFAMLHFTDVHDCKSIFTHPFQLLAYLRFIPKWLSIRKKQKGKTLMFYDLAMMYTDYQIGRLLSKLDRHGQLDDMLIVLTSDHGGGRDSVRDQQLYLGFGFTTFYERCMVPFMMSPMSRKPNKQGLHDTMSVSATLLDVLGIPRHESFKGTTVFQPGKRACVTECAARGSSDPIKQDLYFTVTGERYKLMAELIGKKITPLMLFDRLNDPRELKNVIHEPGRQTIVCEMMHSLYNERRELFGMRGIIIDPNDNGRMN